MIYILSFAIIMFCLLIFWQASLLYSSIFTAPTVYAHDGAILDALKLSGLKEGQVVLDLGCGNAKSLILAAKHFGARGIGAENSYYCFLRSKLNVWLAGQSANIKIIFGDFKNLEADMEKADVIYLYLLNSILADIEDWFFASIGENTKVVVLSFWFPVHKPVKEAATKNLGIDTKVRLYNK